MPKIPFGFGAYRRDAGDMPELRVVNMMAERTPTAEGGVTLISRKGLSEDEELGSGPIQGMFQEPGTFDGDRFVLSGGTLFREGAAVGAVSGTGPVSWASSGIEIVVTAGADAYSYDGTDLEAVVFPDDSYVLAVGYLSQRFVFVPDAPPVGEGAFYWSEINDGRDIDGLSFATAESAPDGLLDCKVIRGNLYLIGRGTIEPWRVTGVADLPYALIQQTIAARGAIGTGCSVEADNGLKWIGQDGILYGWGDVPERLSDNGLEERIIASSAVRLFKYDYEGHVLVCVVTDDDVFAWDAATRQIHNPRSYGLDRFRASCAVNIGTSAYLGDETTGQIWTFDGYADDDGPHERLFTTYFGINKDNVVIDNLWIEANVGRTDLLAGQGSDPVAAARFSDDAGATWTDWEDAELGQQGDYRVIAEWRALGTYGPPGFMAEIRCTEPCGFRVSGVHVNDPIPGRSR